MQVTIVIRSGAAIGRTLELVPGKVGLVGRASWAELSILDDTGISGRHFAIECHPRHCRLRDLRSTNGTFVNGERVAEAFLNHGDQVRAGQTTFAVCIVDVAVEPESAAYAQPPPSVSKTRSGDGGSGLPVQLEAAAPAWVACVAVAVEVVSGPALGRRLVLQPGKQSLVGRASWAELSVHGDDGASGRHCTLLFDHGQCRLQDLSSKNGTFVNGRRVSDAVLSHGDQVAIGGSVFRVTFGDSSAIPMATIADIEVPPLPDIARPTFEAKTVPNPVPIPRPRPPQPAAPPPAAAPEPHAEAPAANLLRLLRNAPEPLFALLDAARDQRVLPLLEASGLGFQSLYEGAQGESLARWAPYVVPLTSGTPFLDTLVANGWGRSWGVFLCSKEPMAEVRKHFRHFLLAQLPDGREAYFRFYDPRVLRAFLPSCGAEQSREFFGPVSRFLLESNLADVLLRFTPGGPTVREESIALWVPTAGAR